MAVRRCCARSTARTWSRRCAGPARSACPTWPPGPGCPGPPSGRSSTSCRPAACWPGSSRARRSGRVRTGRISARAGPASRPGWCGSGPRRPTWSASTSAGARPWSPWPTWPGRSWPGTRRTPPGPAAAPTCWPCCAPPTAARWLQQASGAPTWPASGQHPAWSTGPGARSCWRPGCRAGRSSWPASCAARSAARPRWKMTPTWLPWPNGGTAWPVMPTRWSSSTGASGSAPAS